MPPSLLIRIVLRLWLIAGLAVGRLQLLAGLPAPALPVIIFGLTAGLLAAYAKGGGFRTWLDRLDLRALVLLHVTRFVGFYFIALYRRGELPYAFAVPGGWGDIVVAGLALLVALVPMAKDPRRRAVTIWNVVGLMDILLVVATAGRLAMEDGGQMRALTYLPLSLLPTFLVPLIIFTHVLIFLRLRRAPTPA